MEPIQGLNLNLWYVSGLEPEMPVTICDNDVHQKC